MSFNILCNNDREANDIAKGIVEQMDNDEDNAPKILDITRNEFGSIKEGESVLNKFNEV